MTLSFRLIRRVPTPKESYPVKAEEAIAHEEQLGETDDEQTESAMSQIYRKGYEDGYAACAKATEGEIKEQIEAFKSMVDDLVSQRKRLLKESEEAVLKLSCQIARRIVGKVAEVEESLIGEVVKNAVNHLAERQRMVIRVSDLDFEILRKHENGWLTSNEGVEIKPDKRIKRGGCLVEGETGSVDAQIDSQIDVIEKALLGAAK